MQEAALVRVVERVGDRGADADHLVDRQRPALDARLERAAGHELHDEEVDAVLGVEVEDRRDAGMRETREHVRLAPEALARRVVAQRALRRAA